MNTEHLVGIHFPEILIPDRKINKQKWSVIACDQYTSNEDYWARTSKAVGGAPSTLHIIIPEAHLNDPDVDERIRHAKQTMTDYIEDGVLVRLPQGVMLVERETPHGTRIGLVLAVDLEQYEIDFRTKPLIRATEQTVVERLPIRMKLREGSVIECPHVMLLIDDPKDTVIGPIYNIKAKLPQMYDTPLLMGGGQLKGWFVEGPEALDGIVSSLKNLKRTARDGMLFAVGDGNHSLAAAKGVWERRKAGMTEEEMQDDPLRYALVEVVNLYDHGITMHPIHRVLFNVDVPVALRMLVSILNNQGQEASMIYTRGTRVQHKEGVQTIHFESKMSKGIIEVKKPKHDMVTQTLTQALDALLKELTRARIDYIHGDDEFHELAKGHASLGFLMAPMRKEELFDAVIAYGVLPRKSFSMGVAEEKRYYFECRLLVNADEEEEPEADEQEPDMPHLTGTSGEREDESFDDVYPEDEYPADEAMDKDEDGFDMEEPAEEDPPKRPKRRLFGKRDQ